AARRFGVEIEHVHTAGRGRSWTHRDAYGDGVNRDRLVAKTAPMAGPEGHRQSGPKARNGGQNHDRNGLLSAQSSAVAGAAQPSRSTALEHRKQSALAVGRGHER